MEPQDSLNAAILHQGNPRNRTVIVGGGIVGSAIANYLSEISHSEIIVIESSTSELRGSTGHAPGFVGQLNELTQLTQLAKVSVLEYQKIPSGFDTVGSLEIASTRNGIGTLERRCLLAQEAGLPAQLIRSAEAAELAPQYHKPPENFKTLHIPSDGTANPLQIVHSYRQHAQSHGVIFIEATALSLVEENSHIVEIDTSLGRIQTARVVVATGIWAPQLLQPLGINLPIIPAAHPYVHGPERPARPQKTPFIRWPEQHVYARDHGSFDGFGTYDHVPIRVAVDSLSESAIGEWEPLFDAAVTRARRLFPDMMRKEEMRAFNGIFALTPDGLPFAGRVKWVDGLWVVAGVWITHAAGVAKLVAEMMGSEIEGEDGGEIAGKNGSGFGKDIVAALDPDRFVGRDPRELERRAMATYNNIYNTVDNET